MEASIGFGRVHLAELLLLLSELPIVAQFDGAPLRLLGDPAPLRDGFFIWRSQGSDLTYF